jgi:hypothetical protein
MQVNINNLSLPEKDIYKALKAASVLPLRFLIINRKGYLSGLPLFITFAQIVNNV